MIVLTLTSDSPQTGTTSALVRLGADFAAAGRRTLLLDVLPRIDVARHLSLPSDAPTAGPRPIGPNFIYAGLDARACSYDALAASEAEIVVADIGAIAGAEAQTFLRQVPASVVLGLRASPTMGASYASAVGTFNGLLSQGARIKRAGVFISRLNPNDLTVHQALESVAVAAGTDLLVAPITELVGVGAPALIGTGLGEAYRPLAEAIRDRALDEQRQATPVKVGLGDLATAFQQSGKQIAAQSTQEAFPADASAAASQYTYVLDSQALADVVGSAAAPVVSHSASSAGFRGSSPAPLPSASEHSPTPAVAIQPSVPEPAAAQPFAAQPFAAPAVATQPLAPEPSVNELSTVVADGVESPANIDIETAIDAKPSARRPSRFRLLAAGGALAAVVALAFVLFGRAATSSEAGAVMPSDPRSAETSVAEPPSTDPEPADDSNGPDEPESISEADGPEFELDVPEEPAPKRKKRRRRRAKGEVKR